METNNLSNTSYGECRCCSARGHHRDLNTEYFFNGIREVYREIFHEIFNLILSNNSKLTTLICITCIVRLRNATSFRMMVASTEKQLLAAIGPESTKITEFVDVLNENNQEDLNIKVQRGVKQEIDECDLDLSDTEFVTDPVSDSHYEESNDDITVKGELALLARFETLRPLPILPTRISLEKSCPGYWKQLQLLKGTKIFPQEVARLVEVNTNNSYNKSPTPCQYIPENCQYISEKTAHIVNASTILECSNVTPFKSKSRQGFPCFCCRNIFESLPNLQEHTSQHKLREIVKILRTFGAESLVVYVDVTDLKCSICDQNMQSLNKLKSHIVNIHKKKMYSEFTDRIIPFKLSDSNMYECQLCSCYYETFGAIERHMNVHFRNYVCKDCGTGFVTRYRLKVHMKSMHSGGTYPCEICGKIFSTAQKHKNHVNTVHKLMKRFKCTKCPERFAEYFRRQKHMVEIHGVAPLKYKCNVCDKSFDRRYTLSRHMKRDHLEERDHQCDLCSYRCFTKNELRVHMIKHNGERIHECSVCKKAYARKKTLKEHMRIHNNDRRFTCAVCGQSFVQKCSLKGHVKTHHYGFRVN